MINLSSGRGKSFSIIFLLMILAAGSAFWLKAPLLAFLQSRRATVPSPASTVPATPTATQPDSTVNEPVIDRTAEVIVLGYHRFVDKVRHPDTEITPAEFETQMQALKGQGITVISLDDLLAWRHEQKSLPPRCALITIDDGYAVGYTVAWPILKKYGYPFTMFIYTDYVTGGRKAGGGSMTWEQLAEMRDAGVSIQSHTVSHPDLRKKKGGASQGTYDEWLWNELHGSRAMLEEKLGIKISALALPYGLANDRVRDAAAKAGYEIVFTVNGQKINFSTPMNALGRYMVEANRPELFKTATTFGGSHTVPVSPPTVFNPPLGLGKTPRAAITAHTR